MKHFFSQVRSDGEYGLILFVELFVLKTKTISAFPTLSRQEKVELNTASNYNTISDAVGGKGLHNVLSPPGQPVFVLCLKLVVMWTANKISTSSCVVHYALFRRNPYLVLVLHDLLSFLEICLVSYFSSYCEV